MCVFFVSAVRRNLKLAPGNVLGSKDSNHRDSYLVTPRVIYRNMGLESYTQIAARLGEGGPYLFFFFFKPYPHYRTIHNDKLIQEEEKTAIATRALIQNIHCRMQYLKPLDYSDEAFIKCACCVNDNSWSDSSNKRTVTLDILKSDMLKSV